MCSLVSAFVIRCLDSIINTFASVFQCRYHIKRLVEGVMPVASVTSLSSAHITLQDMREFIPERNLTVVRSVGNHLLTKEICPDTRQPIPGRSLILVKSVGKLFYKRGT